MEVAGKIYKGRKNSKNPLRVDANCASNGRKRKGGEASSPNNPKTGRTDKRNTRNAGHPSDWPNGGKIFLLHGHRHYTEECKVLKDYTDKYTVQWPHK